MASRHLMQCPELLAEIFSHLELASSVATEIDHDQQDLRKALAAAALSCRALTEHALAALWRRLDSVRPLLSLLSKPKRQFPKTNVIMLQADITEQSWRRFQKYARHARALHDKHWSGIHPSTWSFVGRWCGTEPLLPNLEELSVLPLGVQNPTSMIFISPKLRTLSMALRFDEMEPGCGWLRKGDAVVVNTLFRQIMSTAPNIKRLSIKSNVADLSPSCFRRISDLEDLSALHARECVLDFAFLRWLCGCPSLRTLAATIDMTKLPPQPQGPEDEGYGDYYPFGYGFLQLQHLHIRGTPDHIHFFLDTTVPLRLETQIIEFNTCAPPSAITRCVDTIYENARTSRPVLRELSLVYPGETYHDEDEGNTLQHASLVDIIRPALNIHFLRKVTLVFHEIPVLGDGGVLEMVAAWPKLTVLHILPSTRDSYRTQTTLTPAVLAALARQCPRLTELTLPAVAFWDRHERGMRTDNDGGMPLVGQRKLRKLRVFFRDWTSGEDELYTAALFIDRLFPCLDLNPSFEHDDEGEDDEDASPRLSSWEEREREAEKSWRRIEEFLYAMRLGRRHRTMLKEGTSL